MLRIEIPRIPVPVELETAVYAARDVLAKASGAALEAAQAAYDKACDAVRQHYATVGTDRVPVPRDVEAEGPQAVQSFIEQQAARLAVEAAPAPEE